MTGNYQLIKENDRLVFRTPFFRAEKSSVLHAGVYTREFSSMLFASALCVLFYMVTDMASIRTPLVRYGILILIFIVAFLGGNKYIFKEKYLQAEFNKAAGTVTIVRSGLLKKSSETIPFDRIQSVDIGSTSFIPENVDGIHFVQKISAQHGSAVPGLDEVEEYVTLLLRLKDGSEHILYAAKIDGGKVDGEPEIPVGEIRSFLGISA